MGRRLKVLLSAYACEPGKGSEPEVGWQWALHLARHHDVTVLTRTNNRGAIEAALAEASGHGPLPQFVYHDLGPFALAVKRRLNALSLYYVLWQRTARERVCQLHRQHAFDLLHHVTFATFRHPTAVWGQGAPSLWGPVGGMESIPAALLPWSHPASLARELARNCANSRWLVRAGGLRRRARSSSQVLASTPEMLRGLRELGCPARLMPTIGIQTAAIPVVPRTPRTGALRLLYVGNLLALKGIDLALAALALAGGEARLTLMGSGNYEAVLRGRSAALGLGNRVEFLGRLPREEVLRRYPGYDVLLFPSLHDTGGYAVIEAMFNQLPVICLDCGGPAVAVSAGCGIRVPLGERAAIVRGLADAICHYERDRAEVAAHGEAARRRVLEHYDWEKKGEEMAELYREVAEGSAPAPPAS